MVRPAQPPEVGPWAKEKLQALHRYLDYYTKVLKNQRWRTIYLDAFAGGGTAKLRKEKKPEALPDLWEPESSDPEQQEFIKGSPRLALALDNPFDRYVFIDTNGARIAELGALQAQYGEARTISIRPGGAEQEISWVLSQNVDRKTHRAVAFLDPFGGHISWSSIQALAATGFFEVIINFPLHMALARLMKNDADIPATWRAQLDSFFGGQDWFEDVYESSGGLFGTRLVKRTDYLDRLLARYRSQLRKAFGFVSEVRLIKNTRGAPLYYLVWAGPHRKGLEGANHILQMAN
jgi:three-Cys-motif partner protein